MTIDPFVIGVGSAIIAAVLAVFMPVSQHRVNQNLVSILIAIFVFVAAFAFFEIPLALGVGLVVSVGVIAGRGLLRNVRHLLYHNVTRYTRRQYWNQRVGRAILGSGRRTRRRKDDGGLFG
jgi:hypothetical protein